MNTGVRTGTDEVSPERPQEVTEPAFGFDTTGQELAVYRARERHDAKRIETLEAFAMRVEPVCRNCIHAGAASVSGNYPYGGQWGSCQEGAPIAGPDTRLGHYDGGSIGSSARWPAVRHDESCGRFKLRPIVTERPYELVRGDVKWSWQDAPPPS